MRLKNEVKSSGFGSQIENEGVRLINKDGSFNVEKTGVPLRIRFSWFHSLINMSLWKFMLCLLLFFVVINSFFAILYVSLGVENLGLVNQSTGMKFLNAFFFSAQTITTVGYGAIAPSGIGPNLVASLEAFVGLLSFAMASGLLYGRFSRPRAKILYSEQAVIAPYRDHTALMFRLANARSSRMINVHAKMMLSWVEMEHAERKRKFYTLDLEISQIAMLATSWTVVHPINADSPFFELSIEDITERDTEIMISIEGYDESYSQQVHDRTSYKFHEIISGAKFIRILGRNDEGQATIDLDRLGAYEITNKSTNK